MISREQLEKIGFKVNSKNKSPYNGKLTDFYKNIDNGHIVNGHDTTVSGFFIFC